MKFVAQIAVIGGLKRRRNYGSMDRMNIHSYYLIKGKRIIPITFFISIIIHISIIIAFQGIFPFNLLKPERRTYKVDLIRPPIKEIKKHSKESDPAVSQIHSELPVENKEATISLNTKDPTYHPYTKVIKQKIFNYWIYPLSAQQNLIQGNLLIVFRLGRDGSLVDCNIETSSGHTILDKHAIKAIRLANPFPPFPDNITVQFLNIYASFAYQLTFE
jgi:TonB family protein